MMIGAADEAEFLAGDGEDEVGLLLGDELALGLRAGEQAATEQTPVGIGDQRLLDVVADARGVHRAVLEELGEPRFLIRLEQVELQDGGAEADA